MHPRTQPILLTLTTLLTLGAAGPSIAADELKSARYVCPDGERFSVEYKASHARLRNSSGVFTLTADGNANARRYSDGTLVLSPHDGGAMLQRVGQPVPDDCQSDPHRS